MPPTSQSLVDHIEQVLRARIADGTYPVDSRLPSHAELAAEFGVASATTVRTAVTRLERDRLVVGHRGRGTIVTAAEAPPERAVTRERERPWITEFHPDQSVTVALTLSPQPTGWRSEWFAGELDALGRLGEFPRPGGRSQIFFRVDHHRLEDLVEDVDALVAVQNTWFREVEWPRRRRAQRAIRIEQEVRAARAAAEESGEDPGQVWQRSVIARAEGLQSDVGELSPRYTRTRPPIGGAADA